MTDWINPAHLGLAHYGENVQISKGATLLNPGRIWLGDNVRIDQGCYLSAGECGITLMGYNHLSIGVKIYGGGGRVFLDLHATLSADVKVYTANDDYTDGYLIGPQHPIEYRKLTQGGVVLDRFAAVGAGSVLLPQTSIYLGGVLGALSMLRSGKTINRGEIWAGSPLRKVGVRNVNKLLELSGSLLSSR